MEKILIVEDDETLRDELSNLLSNSGYEVLVLTDFKNSKEEIIKLNPDLILLDINIPYLNGETLLKSLRDDKVNTPVIMLTSSNKTIDEVLSISYGADDYITKPYNPTILLLRINNIFKRMKKSFDYLEYDDLKIYPIRVQNYYDFYSFMPFLNIDKNIKVAVMGCAVNGPGEAREADIGIAGGHGEGLIFKKGEILRKVPEEKLVDELLKEIALL